MTKEPRMTGRLQCDLGVLHRGLDEKVRFEPRCGGSEEGSKAEQRSVGRSFQAEETAGRKASWQQQAWNSQRTARG